MARVNIDIPGISELKWTGMGKFNSDDYYIYYCGQITQNKWNSPHSKKKKESEKEYMGAISKMKE